VELAATLLFKAQYMAIVQEVGVEKVEIRPRVLGQTEATPNLVVAEVEVDMGRLVLVQEGLQYLPLAGAEVEVIEIVVLVVQEEHGARMLLVEGELVEQYHLLKVVTVKIGPLEQEMAEGDLAASAVVMLLAALAVMEESLGEEVAAVQPMMILAAKAAQAPAER